MKEVFFFLEEWERLQSKRGKMGEKNMGRNKLESKVAVLNQNDVVLINSTILKILLTKRGLFVKNNAI